LRLRCGLKNPTLLFSSSDRSVDWDFRAPNARTTAATRDNCINGLQRRRPSTAFGYHGDNVVTGCPEMNERKAQCDNDDRSW